MNRWLAPLERAARENRLTFKNRLSVWPDIENVLTPFKERP